MGGTGGGGGGGPPPPPHRGRPRRGCGEGAGGDGGGGGRARVDAPIRGPVPVDRRGCLPPPESAGPDRGNAEPLREDRRVREQRGRRRRFLPARRRPAGTPAEPGPR